jgi:hypothetical protein
MAPGPLGSSQGPPRVGKAPRPVKRQSSLPSLALQHDVHRSMAWSRWNASGRNVGVGLEWQLSHVKPVLDENFGSLLPDVAERAKEVIPVQHRAVVIPPVLVATCSVKRGHMTTPLFSLARLWRFLSFRAAQTLPVKGVE